VIVVLGAGTTAATGCAGKSGSSGTPGAGGTSGGLGFAGTTQLSLAGNGCGGTSGLGIAGSSVTGAGEGGDASPTPCEHTQQYLCASVNGVVECRCDPYAPLSQADCDAGREFSCMSYDPPTGCDCGLVTGPK